MNLGAPEIIGIIVLALLLFGSRKLPELGSSVGKTITNFKQGMADAKDEEAQEATPVDAKVDAPADVPAAETADDRA